MSVKMTVLQEAGINFKGAVLCLIQGGCKMKLFKLIGCFVILTCVCMLPVVLGGTELYTSAFGSGLGVSMVISLVMTSYIFRDKSSSDE